MSRTLHLADERDTLALGRLLAKALPEDGPPLAILFEGPMGAGKTTLIRGLVGALPGGSEAEAASPSFNLMNLYPTRPEVAHIDLYRLEGLPLDESVAERLHEGDGLVLIEWAERLAAQDRPASYLLLAWLPCPNGRRVAISAHGEEAQDVLTRIAPGLTRFVPTAS